ncbi:MAG: hypothetical protein PVI30_04825 [Myxococcales bacterium]
MTQASDQSEIQQRILHALFQLCRDNQPVSAASLAELAGTTATAAGRALVAMERAGLVDASRARLTMLGLARAVATGAQSGGPRLMREAEAQREARDGELPVAAQPSVPPPAPLHLSR